MGKSSFYETKTTSFNPDTGEITYEQSTKRFKNVTNITDEYVKISKYFSVIFAYNHIPTSLVNISLVIAQRMEYETNMVYLLKDDKVEIGDFLGLERRYRRRKNKKTGEVEITDVPDTNTIDKMIRNLCDYNIIRPTGTRGKYEVNAFLFSTGSSTNTRDLQAHFDFDNDLYCATTKQNKPINGETVRKAVANKKAAFRLIKDWGTDNGERN